MNKEAEEMNEEVEENNTINDQPIAQNMLDSHLLLLLIILFIFFDHTDTFSSYFQLLNTNLNQIKSYVETAEAALQGLEQTSKIPQQMLK